MAISDVAPSAAALETNKVLKNTFLLLGATVLFSALTAGLAIATSAAMMNPWIMLLVYFGLLFGVEKTKETSLGIVMCFALTGFLGYVLGPIVAAYLTFVGSEVVMMAFGLTACIFFGLSGYAMFTKRDFSYLTGFLMVGILVAFAAGIIALIFSIPLLSLVVSGAFVILSSLLILWQISAIIHGGETNYISATVTLYVSLYNLFTSLLHILGASSGDD